MTRRIRIAALAAVLFAGSAAWAGVSETEAARLGTELNPMGGIMAGSDDGSIPAWTGGLLSDTPPPAGKERHPEQYPTLHDDKPLYTVTAADAERYAHRLTAGARAMLERYPSTYKMIVYPSRRTVALPDAINQATRRNATAASLASKGESLVGAITGIPFPIPTSGVEVIWNHKLRYRGVSLSRYNAQLAVQANGAFLPYVLREDVRFQYNQTGITPESLENVLIYFLQFTTEPQRQAGNVVLVHETMDQVAEPRRAWQYNPGQRRIRRAPNIAYDNPGTGADGLRTNDQLDAFNGATDRYTWKLVGRKEMIVPYNSIRLGDDRLRYRDIARTGHIDQDLVRYELHRVWVVEAELKPDTSHIYQRRTFYVDEDSWTILAVDCYDRRNQLWRVQETHQWQVPWLGRVAPVAGTVYDLQSSRYLVQELSNESPMFEDKELALDHFTTGAVQRMAIK